MFESPVHFRQSIKTCRNCAAFSKNHTDPAHFSSLVHNFARYSVLLDLGPRSPSFLKCFLPVSAPVRHECMHSVKLAQEASIHRIRIVMLSVESGVAAVGSLLPGRNYSLDSQAFWELLWGEGDIDLIPCTAP